MDVATTPDDLEEVPLHEPTVAQLAPPSASAAEFDNSDEAKSFPQLDGGHHEESPYARDEPATVVRDGDEDRESSLQKQPFSTDLVELDEYTKSTTTSHLAKAKAQFHANPSVRVARRFLHNAVNKLEDIGIGLVGVTEGIADVGEGVGRTAVSGVGAVGGAVEAGILSAVAGQAAKRHLPGREVDTIKEVDISGTILKDLNRAIEVEKMKGTSNAESPLNTPWILIIIPILPIFIMYAKVTMSICVPPIWKAILSIWFFVGWRLWLCLAIATFVFVTVFWKSIKAIEPLRPVTMQIDVEVIKFRRKVFEEMNKQMPKIYKVLDRTMPPLRNFMRLVDTVLTPRLGYSPLLALRAKVNGWKFDPRISEMSLTSGSMFGFRRALRQSLQHAIETSAVDEVTDVRREPRDGGHSTIVDEDGIEKRISGVEFDLAATQAAAGAAAAVEGAGELFEEFFAIELHLEKIEELHRKYTSVWVEWIYRGMVVDRSVIRDIETSKEWNGFGASFKGCKLSGEVCLPLQADTTIAKGGFHDVPIKLVLKGRDGLALYSNDGARRYMRDSPTSTVIGEIEVSAMKIGVGTYAAGIVRSELRVPLHAIGVTQYRAAVLHASARIAPVDSSSYSYRQMLSPLPNGEWTVRVNIFELRNLRGVDDSGSSDPYVSVRVMGMTQSTDRQRQTLSCMVNQLLFFSKVCTGLEFEDEKIVIEVMDWNRFGAAQTIGVYTLDAKRVLELPGQELFRKWFALQDPKGGKRPAGFIKMSITVVQPGGTPPQHDDTEDREEFSSATLLKNTVLKPPKMSYENWAVHITIGWADMLPRMSSGHRDAIRGYITLSYSGYPECTTSTFIAEAKEIVDNNIGEACVVLPQRRLIWNEEYILPLTIINNRVAQEGIQLKLYHRTMPRATAPLRGDLLIGQVNVSFEELFRNMSGAVVRGQPADNEDEGDRIRQVAMMKPRYYNFYGKPDGVADPYDKGIAFRGRVLVGVAAKPGDVASTYLRPCPPPPRPRLEFYKLDFCVLQATELPLPDGWSVRVEGRIGLHQFGHTIPMESVQTFSVQWEENCAVSIPNLQFPEDVDQIPDLFITLSARKRRTVEELEERKISPDSHEMSPSEDIEKPRRLDADIGVGVGITTAVDANAEPHSGISGLQRNPTTESSENAEDEGSPSYSPDVPGSSNGGSADSTWKPKAFLRLPAKHLICSQTEPRWMFMDYPGNNVLESDDNRVPGSILISASLSKYEPTSAPVAEEEVAENGFEKLSSPIPQFQSFKNSQVGIVHEPESIVSADMLPANQRTLGATGAVVANHRESLGHRRSSAVKSNTYGFPLGPKRSYTLRAYIVQGRNLPAADETGLSDPVVHVSMGNRHAHGKVIVNQTISPLWQDLIEVRDITIRDGERKPNVNVLVYDWDNAPDKNLQYLGRAIIPSAELDSADPTLLFSKWYPVFSVNPGIIVGEILADFQLIPTETAIERPIVKPTPSPLTESALRISLVGLRDVKFLKFAAGDIFVECCIPGKAGTRESSKRGAILQHRAYEANCNILDVLVVDISIPEDLRLAPALTILVYAVYKHHPKPDMIASACITLEQWLSAHERKLLTGESLIDDSFGMDAPVPDRLFSNDRGYKFKRRAKRVVDDREEEMNIALHQVKAYARSESKNLAVLQEKRDVLRVGFDSPKKEESKEKKKKMDEKAPESESQGLRLINSALAPFRALKYQVADAMADLMPDIAMALGVEVDEDVPLSSLTGVDSEKIDYDGTRLLKNERGHCSRELEVDFNEPAYGEFLLFRGDNRSLGNTTGRMDSSASAPAHNASFPPVFPFNEAPSYSTLVKREQRRTALEGSRPAVGKVKARLDLVEIDATDKAEKQKARLSSLRSFGRVFVPTEVVVRVYVLRGINLQQFGPACNPYLTCRFYGGYPDFFSRKHEPILDDDNPNFFQMFESRVKMPGGAIRIEVKDRMLPEVTLPVAFPKPLEGSWRIGWAQHDVPVNFGKLGFGWSEVIGETMIDLDARWYNSSWRSLLATPVETRSLFSEDSSNLKGQLELFVDIFDAKEVDKRPKLYRPIPISKPKQDNFELRVVIYKISEVYLPYQLRDNDPDKLASFYVQVRLGNRPEDTRKTEPPCKYVSDGLAEFNWRMKWQLQLPSLEIKPRLKLQIFDDTSFGVGNDQLCAVADVRLRSLFDEIVMNKKPIIKKKQWVTMHHPNHPDVAAQIQLSLELTTESAAAKKKCFAGKDGYKDTQHQDYILPLPFQPAAFSLYNPVPYFNYLIVSSIKNLQWHLATILLIFPFFPMFFQFVFMLTPWTWYAAGGVAGLIVFIRIMLVQSARLARMQAESKAAAATLRDEESDEEN